MDIYDYYEAVSEDLKECIKECIKENFPEKEDWDEFRDQFGDIDKDKVIEYISEIEDDEDIINTVTGSGIGSYTSSSIDAEQNFVGNYDLLVKAMRFSKLDAKGILETLEHPELADVLIRCSLIPRYSFSQMIPDALEEVMDEMDVENKSIDVSIFDKLQSSKDKANGINFSKEAKAVAKDENEIS